MSEIESNFVSLLSDTTFKYLFKNDNTRCFLESIILNKTGVDLRDFNLTSEEDNTGNKVKDYRMDLVLAKDNQIVIIEMNRNYKKSQDIKNRQYLYRKAGTMFDKGDKYNKDINVKLIMFNNYYNRQDKDIKTVKYSLCDPENNLKIEDIEIYEIYLPIYKKMCYDSSNIIDKRLSMFTSKSYEDMKKTEDEVSLRVVKELENLSMNEIFRDEYDYENVQRKLINSVKDEGYEEGLQNGLQKGYENGTKENSIQIAKKMLEAGEEIDKIILYTDLTQKEIDNLMKIL